MKQLLRLLGDYAEIIFLHDKDWSVPLLLHSTEKATSLRLSGNILNIEKEFLGWGSVMRVTPKFVYYLLTRVLEFRIPKLSIFSLSTKLLKRLDIFWNCNGCSAKCSWSLFLRTRYLCLTQVVVLLSPPVNEFCDLLMSTVIIYNIEEQQYTEGR